MKFTERGATVLHLQMILQDLERVKAACGEKSNMVHCVPFDLSDTSDIEKIVEQQINFRQNRLFINIGGISQRARIDETPLWLDRKIFEINYFGTIALTKAVLPYMIRQKSGHILATSSISGRFGFPLRSAYSASKQALHGFFETLYLENKKYNIRSSVIIPGRVRTSISFHALTSEGKEHGKLDEGLAKGISPEQAAKIIIRGIERNKREILVGKGEMIMLHIRRYLPWLFFRIADKEYKLNLYNFKNIYQNERICNQWNSADGDRRNECKEAWKWYIDQFGMDCRIFEDEAVAKLMLPYTGGEPRSRHAVLALNLQSGGGFEIWQYKGREPVKIKEEIRIGDLGIIACKMKVKNIKIHLMNISKVELMYLMQPQKIHQAK